MYKIIVFYNEILKWHNLKFAKFFLYFKKYFIIISLYQRRKRKNTKTSFILNDIGLLAYGTLIGCTCNDDQKAKNENNNKLKWTKITNSLEIENFLKFVDILPKFQISRASRFQVLVEKSKETEKEYTILRW